MGRRTSLETYLHSYRNTLTHTTATRRTYRPRFVGHFQSCAGWRLLYPESTGPEMGINLCHNENHEQWMNLGIKNQESVNIHAVGAWGPHHWKINPIFNWEKTLGPVSQAPFQQLSSASSRLLAQPQPCRAARPGRAMSVWLCVHCSVAASVNTMLTVRLLSWRIKVWGEQWSVGASLTLLCVGFDLWGEEIQASWRSWKALCSHMGPFPSCGLWVLPEGWRPGVN